MKSPDVWAEDSDSEGSTADREMRIQQMENRFRNGQQLYIMSASLKSELTNNPWARIRKRKQDLAENIKDYFPTRKITISPSQRKSSASGHLHTSRRRIAKPAIEEASVARSKQPTKNGQITAKAKISSTIQEPMPWEFVLSTSTSLPSCKSTPLWDKRSQDRRNLRLATKPTARLIDFHDFDSQAVSALHPELMQLDVRNQDTLEESTIIRPPLPVQTEPEMDPSDKISEFGTSSLDPQETCLVNSNRLRPRFQNPPVNQQPISRASSSSAQSHVEPSSRAAQADSTTSTMQAPSVHGSVMARAPRNPSTNVSKVGKATGLQSDTKALQDRTQEMTLSKTASPDQNCIGTPFLHGRAISPILTATQPVSNGLDGENNEDHGSPTLPSRIPCGPREQGPSQLQRTVELAEAGVAEIVELLQSQQASPERIVNTQAELASAQRGLAEALCFDKSPTLQASRFGEEEDAVDIRLGSVGTTENAVAQISGLGSVAEPDMDTQMDDSDRIVKQILIGGSSSLEQTQQQESRTFANFRSPSPEHESGSNAYSPLTFSLMPSGPSDTIDDIHSYLKESNFNVEEEARKLACTELDVS